MDKTIKNLESIWSKAEGTILKASSKPELEQVKIELLGRKSQLNEVLKGLKDLDPSIRGLAGKQANQLKLKISKLIDKQQAQIELKSDKEMISKEWIDVTVPGERPSKGALHPITQLLWKTTDIFEKMGFEVVLPYEIDDDYHNFESVNLPKGHPARDSWDTFWTEDENILITHTSSMQNRVLRSKTPPIRAIVPGKCFRNEATDARHEHTFYQVEGIYVDKGITFTDMLGTLKTYFEAFFEKEIQVKFMPDFFPFVEPGGQMALSCVLCDMKGCKVCKGTGWLEILGCGMIHPNVLKEAGIDTDLYTGFAWGFGLERLIMLKQNIEDMRIFHSGDLRFIRQFK